MNEIRQNDHDDQEDEPIDEKHDNQSADNYVTFRDTKWFLNFMMAVNVVLIFLRSLLPMPVIVRKISNIYTCIWIAFSLLNCNGYFKTFAYSRVAIDSPQYS